MHLRVATERLAARFTVPIERHKPQVGYRETIKKPVLNGAGAAASKKQSGGHGQFGDVVIDVKPLPRGSGFKLNEVITGGAVPRNYIPSVEDGVTDAIKHGPLGVPGRRPRGDVDRRLVSRSRTGPTWRSAAGRLGIHDALPQAQPVLGRADPSGRDRVSERGHRQDQRHHVGAARTDPRFRYARGLVRLGLGEGNDPGDRDRRPDHRNPLGDGRRRHVRRPSSTTAGLTGRRPTRSSRQRKPRRRRPKGPPAEHAGVAEP